MDLPNAEESVVRRKTCAPCHRRKTRCDSKRPKCSTCELWGTVCTDIAGVRTKKSLLRQASQEPDANESESSRFEGRVETAQGSFKRHLPVEEPVTEDDEQEMAWTEHEISYFSTIAQIFAESLAEDDEPPSEEDDQEMSCTQDKPSSFSTVTPIYPEEGYNCSIPPDVENEYQMQPKDQEHCNEAEITKWLFGPPSLSGLPSRYRQHHQNKIINAYIEGFDQTTLLFNKCEYHEFEKHCKHGGSMDNEWCAIYVMLALSLRNDPKNYHQGDDVLFIKQASTYVDKYGYRLSNELGLQIVLGITLYFMTTWDLERAGFLLAKAVKLVYRLGLHKRSGDAARSSCVRLLWIAYIIDRDLSHLTGEPYLMQERDIAPSTKDIYSRSGGIERDEDRSTLFKILGLRAILATLQGKIFDLIYSVQASKLSFDQREAGADQLDEILERWAKLIPERFRDDKFLSVDPALLRYSRQLHVTYYHCIFSIRQATLSNEEWVDQLLNFGEARRTKTPDTPLLPSNWSRLVTAARQCLDILTTVDNRDMAFRWSSTLAAQAAMTILAANNITLSEHDFHDSIDKDQERLHVAHGEVSDRLKEDLTGSTEKSFNTCGKLIIKARESVRRFNESKGTGEPGNT